jgi:hypothetical protein
MQKIQTIMTAVKRMAWDKIPEDVLVKYERELSILQQKEHNEFRYRQASIQLYNRLFSGYGYTKPEL